MASQPNDRDLAFFKTIDRDLESRGSSQEIFVKSVLQAALNRLQGGLDPKSPLARTAEPKSGDTVLEQIQNSAEMTQGAPPGLPSDMMTLGLTNLVIGAAQDCFVPAEEIKHLQAFAQSIQNKTAPDAPLEGTDDFMAGLRGLMDSMK